MADSLGEHRLGSATQGPAGIGGWLLLPALHLFMDAFIVFVGIFDVLSRPQAITEGARIASDAFTLLSMVIGFFAVYCVMRLFQKKRNVPALMSWFYLLILGKLFLSAILTNLYPDMQIPAEFRASIMTVFGAAVAAVIWIAYFKRSIRVRNTFVT